MNAREKLIEALEGSPKTLSELKEETGLKNGSIQFHTKKCDDIKKKKGAYMLEGQCDGCDDRCEDTCIQVLLRDRRKVKIARLRDEGLTQSEIGDRLDLSVSTVNYHIRDLRRNGALEDGELTDYAEKILEEQE